MTMSDKQRHAFEDAVAKKDVDWDAGRRAFMRSVGLGAAGLTMLGGAAGLPSLARADHLPGDDAAILNFALNLEYLEAEFYLQAAFGRNLNDEDTTGEGDRGGVIGGRKVNFDTDIIRQYAEEIALDEEAHVKFLRSVLQDGAVARPTIDIRKSFNMAARAAGLGDKFDPYENENNFLLGAFIFEDVGVTAYKGAAPLITDKGVLEAAAGLLAVEAYHASNIRTVLISRGLFKPAREISQARDRIDGGGNNDQGIGNKNQANVVPADKNGLAFSRTAGQVLNIVYLKMGAKKGGFFPDGVNGPINEGVGGGDGEDAGN